MHTFSTCSNLLQVPMHMKIFCEAVNILRMENKYKRNEYIRH